MKKLGPNESPNFLRSFTRSKTGLPNREIFTRSKTGLSNREIKTTPQILIQQFTKPEIQRKKVKEYMEECVKTKAQITNFIYGSLDNEYVIKQINTTHGGMVMFDTFLHMVRYSKNRICLDEIVNGEYVLERIKEVYYNEGAFTALTFRNTIVTFGLSQYGGEGPETEIQNVIGVTSTSRGFAAWTSEGFVHTWGHQLLENIDDSSMDLKDVLYVVSSTTSYASLNKHGKVHTWNSEGIENVELLELISNLKDIVLLKSIDKAFAALDIHGNVYTWSSIFLCDDNKKMDKQEIIEMLKTEDDHEFYEWIKNKKPNIVKFHDVKRLVSTGNEFGAITNDGEFFVWGNYLKKENRLESRPHIHVKMRPGEPGIEVNDNGYIEHVLVDSPLFSAGISEGCRIVGIYEGCRIFSIDSTPFSKDAFNDFIFGTKKYVLKISRPILVRDVTVKYGSFLVEFKGGLHYKLV